LTERGSGVAAVSTTLSKKQGVGASLRLTGFRQLFGELTALRISDDLKMLEAAKGSALILPFVKGLRLSAQLAYILRNELSETSLEVDWGHLLDENEKSCSPECDIIIHKTGHVQEWNGNEHPIMHFKFVRRERAVAVISCKSFAKDVDAAYVKKLTPYVKHVFLFAECCAPGKVARLERTARKAGYAGFGYLYTFDKKRSECVQDEKAWGRFLDAVNSKIKTA
jgi:hypothetical protein